MANKFIDRISTLDLDYTTGDLSLYPTAKDDKEQLYIVSNNAITKTTQSISYSLPYIIVEDTSTFPEHGLIQLGTETIYYQNKTSNKFYNLKRGFSGSRQNQWPIGTKVVGAVFAEPHNAVKDAIIKIEQNLGLEEDPDVASLNGILKSLEARFLAPRPIFKAMPRGGAAPLKVKFQNFTTGDILRYFWEFGDGSTSTEESPSHTYLAEGNYTVKLSIITTLGAQGIATKTDYIVVSNNNKTGFFYFTPGSGTTSTVFDFIDQTDGEIVSRYWVWDDGTNTVVTDPNNHTATHQYSAAGTYNPSLLVVFSDDSKKIIKSKEPLVVS